MPSVALLTIEDDDTRPTVQFSRSVYSVDEDASLAIIIATLSASVDLTATVGYTTIDKTATSGDDYILSSGTLTFPPGETVEGFAVQIINDDLDEPDETITLELRNCHNTLIGVPNKAVLTIVDDDGEPTIRFTSDAYSIKEDTGMALLTTTLSNQTVYTVTANFSTSDGTATSNDDYMPVTRLLVLPPGQTVITSTVNIINDSSVEGDETMLLTLGTPVSAMLSWPYSATLIIEDDDRLVGSVFLPAIMKDYCTFTGPYECEPNNSYLNANGPLSTATDYYGFHSGSGQDWDYYKLYQSEEGQITIALTDITDDEAGQSVQLQVFFDSTEIRVGSDVEAPYYIICPSTGSPECTGGMPGWYYILVYTPAEYSSSTPYKLRVTYP